MLLSNHVIKIQNQIPSNSLHKAYKNLSRSQNKSNLAFYLSFVFSPFKSQIFDEMSNLLNVERDGKVMMVVGIELFSRRQ